MAGAKFQYDESGGTFFYFLLAFLALLLIPSTWYFWPTQEKIDNDKLNKECKCDKCQVKRSRLSAKNPWKRVKNVVIYFLIIVGWVLFCILLYRVTTLERDYVDWDPFEILGIDRGSTDKQIRKAYRSLSLVLHPDKETGDEKKFMQLTKAYAALTDDEAKRNWEMYGNPDGPGAMSFGIALPSWIVEKENSVWVLGLYTLVFMIALPTAVGIWWYRSIRYSGDQVLLDTTQLYYYFIHKSPLMNMKRVMMVIAGSMEFEKNHNSEVVERQSDNFEVPMLMKELPNLGEKNKEQPLCYPYSIKARALLHAHLLRLSLPQDTLEKDKLYVVKKCPYLINELVQCITQLVTLAHAGRIQKTPAIDTLEHAMRLSQMVVQGLWENKSPMLQLPHINESSLRHFNTKKRHIKTISQLAAMTTDDRLSLLRSFSESQYNDIMKVLSTMPLVVMDVILEVVDDEDATTITAGAIVTLTIKLTRQNMEELFKDKNVGGVPESDANPDDQSLVLAAIDDNEEESTAKSKTPVWHKQQKKKGKGGKGKKKGKPQHIQPAKKTQQNKENEGAEPEARSRKAPKGQSQQEGGPCGDQSGSEHSDNESQSDCESEVSVEHADLNDMVQEQVDVANAAEDSEEEDWDRFQEKIGRKEKILETRSKMSHEVHCPYYPEEKQEYWWVYVADKKTHMLITAPYQVTNLVTSTEVQQRFTAPTKPGLYQYAVYMRSDSYIDFDIVKILKLNVHEAKEPVVTHPQWDISDDEEDKAKDDDDDVSDFISDEESDGDGK